DVVLNKESFSEEDVEHARSVMTEVREVIESIQKQVGFVWVEFVDVGLWDQETEVTIDNRDSNFTEIYIDGFYSVGVYRKDLEEFLKMEPEILDNQGVRLYAGLATLVLYREDIEYLLE